jgi:hypothetical protein
MLENEMKRTLFVLTIVLFVTSCTPDNSPSILDGQVCGQSCWNQIVIGKTTRKELKEIIAKIHNADQTSVRHLDNPNTDVFFQVYRDWQNKKIPVNVSVTTNKENGNVYMIVFNGDLGLTAQKIAGVFGEPDFATSQPSADGGVCVSLINSQQGTRFYNCAYSEKYSITPEAKVKHLVLFDPAMFQTLVDANFLKAGPNFILYPWAGYGKIEDHYWPSTK